MGDLFGEREGVCVRGRGFRGRWEKGVDLMIWGKGVWVWFLEKGGFGGFGGEKGGDFGLMFESGEIVFEFGRLELISV